MKRQDVLLKAMAKKFTWWEPAEIIGVADRTMRRWRERLGSDGYSGLVDRCKGKASDKRRFHEKLSAEHGIKLSYTWVQKALQGATAGGARAEGTDSST